MKNMGVRMIPEAFQESATNLNTFVTSAQSILVENLLKGISQRTNFTRKEITLGWEKMTYPIDRYRVIGLPGNTTSWAFSEKECGLMRENRWAELFDDTFYSGNWTRWLKVY